MPTKVDMRNAARMERAMKANGRYVTVLRPLWAAEYERDLQEHYDAASKGGRDWPPLAPSTLKRRRAAGVTHRLILVFTGASRAAFRLGAALSQSSLPKGVKVRLDRRTRAGKILSYHDEGGPTLPRRPVMTSPTAACVRRMQRVAKDTFDRVMSFARKR